MKVSIVTISYNQAEFVEQTIKSVVEQDYDNIEYIVVDPGSTDGSREIISKYRDQISKIIFEPDKGPVDGLMKGFKSATGDIYGFLNSDDILRPNALSKVVEWFQDNYGYDAVLGNGYVISESNEILKKIYPDKYNLKQFARGNVTFIQASMFFKGKAFWDVDGFNMENKVSWDAELLLDFGMKGFKIGTMDEFLSGFRVHKESIRGTKRLDEIDKVERERFFQMVFSRKMNSFDRLILPVLRLKKILLRPKKIAAKIGAKV